MLEFERHEGIEAEVAHGFFGVEFGSVEGHYLRQAFLDAYRGIYGYASSDAVEAVNIRLRASGINENRLDFTTIGASGTGTSSVSTRRVYFDRTQQWVETAVRPRSGFSGTVLGPLIIESPDTTIVIPAGATVSADSLGNLVAELH